MRFLTKKTGLACCLLLSAFSTVNAIDYTASVYFVDGASGDETLKATHTQ